MTSPRPGPVLRIPFAAILPGTAIPVGRRLRSRAASLRMMQLHLAAIGIVMHLGRLLVLLPLGEIRLAVAIVRRVGGPVRLIVLLYGNTTIR